MSNVVIKAEGLGKKYRIGALQTPQFRTLRDVIAGSGTRLRKRFSREAKQEREKEQSFWALRDVSFEVQAGDVVGIVGRNGAGKSTLLKVLSRITEPTEGGVDIHGRVGSLLEVGTGFHPELTGRENTYLNGAILGMARADIDRQFDNIVEFAEVAKFIDTPVKHYSSGMYLRLAFAVAAHLEPEILIVDEVLAVGDAQFQKKCLGKMDDVSKTGRTVIFVSHNMGAVARLCRSCILLQSGKVLDIGPAATVVSHYQAMAASSFGQWSRPEGDSPSGEVFFTRIQIAGECTGGSSFAGDEPITLEVEYRVQSVVSPIAISVRVQMADGTIVFTTSDGDADQILAQVRPPGLYRASVTIPGRYLAPGIYSITVAAHSPRRVLFENLESIIAFEVSPVGSWLSVDDRLGVVTPCLRWQTAPALDPVESGSPAKS